MSIQVKRLPGEPILVISFTGSLISAIRSPGHSLMHRQIADLFAEAPGVITLIIDIREASLSFSDMVLALDNVRREIVDVGGRSFVEKNFQYALVGQGDLVELAADAMGQKQYGQIEVLLFSTPDEAIDYAHRKSESGTIFQTQQS